MVSKSTANVMYRLKPVFEVPTSFKNSSSMYKLKPIKHKFFNSSSNSAVVEQKNNSKVDTSCAAKIASLILRQEKLLENLSVLKQRICSFHSKRENVNIVETTDGSSNTSSTVVVNADPRYPPHSFIALLRLGLIGMNVTFENVTTTSSLADSVYQFIEKIKKLSVKPAQVIVSIVWKEVGKDCQLIISPLKNKIIHGEPNVLRYFGRKFIPFNDNLHETISDNILDLVTRLVQTSGNKKLYSHVLKQLNESIGNNKWFVNNVGPSVADVAVWSACCAQQDNVKNYEVPELQKWLQVFDETLEISK